MSRVFFDRPLDTVASFWRILRRDGVAHAFTAHDRDLWFDGLAHLAAPGLLPAAIRRTAGLEDDGTEIGGALAHDTICAHDLALGRFDSAAVIVGAVDWQSLAVQVLYRGEIAGVEREGSSFTAALRSAKAMLAIDPVPRTSPTCRARFCDRGCTLPARAFTRRLPLSEIDSEAATVRFAGLDGAPYVDGELRWIDGPLAGQRCGIVDATGDLLRLDRVLAAAPPPGTRAELREGCDHTIATCAARFGNAVNFRGEPHVPGNDLLARYPQPR